MERKQGSVPRHVSSKLLAVFKAQGWRKQRKPNHVFVDIPKNADCLFSRGAIIPPCSICGIALLADGGLGLSAYLFVPSLVCSAILSSYLGKGSKGEAMLNTVSALPLLVTPAAVGNCWESPPGMFHVSCLMFLLKDQLFQCVCLSLNIKTANPGAPSRLTTIKQCLKILKCFIFL